MLPPVEHIPPPFCLRCAYGLRHPSCGLRCAHVLEEVIEALGQNTVSAFLAEPVIGATLAVVVPPPGYWELIQDICRRHRVLLILDEVMTGMGRTGKWFASQHYGAAPDIMTLGKGISGGALPLSAVGVRQEHYETVISEGGFVHGGTFSHHPVCAAAGVATIEIIEKEGLIARARDMGAELGATLRHRLEDLPQIAQVRGLGMLWGVEIVQDKKSLAPYPRQLRMAERLWDFLFQNGVILYKSIGFADGDGDALIVAPPFTVSHEEIALIVDKLCEALEKVPA